MNVTLKRPWKIWSAGQGFPAMPDNVASELIRLGIAVETVPSSAPILSRKDRYATRVVRAGDA